MTKNYLSVIIPVYNVQDYLRDSLDTVIQQSIGFQDAIQLILVNDGSTDTSGAICEEYARKYPANIIYVQQKNGGVSRARNVGLTYATGEYVHFFDGDDLLSRNIYKEAIRFLQSSGGAVDFVAAKIKFFDGIIDSHPLNYKFKKPGLVNLSNRSDVPILHLPTCIFKRDSLAGHTFDEKLKISEDVAFLSHILRSKKAYGLLKKATYFYRKRSDKSSAIDRKLFRRDYYIETPKSAYGAMINDWSDASGHIDRYMQYTLLYDISYRLDQSSQSVLSSSEEEDYKEYIKNIIQRCDDEVIIQTRSLDIYKKIYALKLKYGKKFRDHVYSKGESYYFDSWKLIGKADVKGYIDFIHVNSKGDFTFEGYLDVDPLYEDQKTYIELANTNKQLNMVPRAQRARTFLGDTLYTGGAFEVTLKPEQMKSGKICFTYGESYDDSSLYNITSKIYTGVFTGLGKLAWSYKRHGNLVFRKTAKSRLQVSKNNFLKNVLFEFCFTLRIVVDWKIGRAFEQFAKLTKRNLNHLSVKALIFEVAKPGLVVAEAIVMIPRALLLRSLYFLFTPFKKQPIWMISDRGMAAGDNGEALFRYIKTQSTVSNNYFAISKKSSDFNRMKQYGKIVDQASLRYKLLFLLSDMVISSHADIETTNPFIRQIDHYVNLFNFNFVFLQHGIIRDDISSWLNRFEKNIKLFVTSSEYERNSVLENPYYYDKESVILTGMPRFDFLEDIAKKKLIIAPTYRKELTQMKTDKSGKRGYDPSFRGSDYFAFYQALLKDKKLDSVLKTYGMEGEFYLHPALEAQRIDFQGNEHMKVMDYPYDYTKAFNEGGLLVSDHSSLVFDFAYLKKPIIYAHFDIENLFVEHEYGNESYYSDERDGFGPVYKEYHATVDGIISIVKEGCDMSEEYSERVDTFFYKRDQKNSQRVYEAIVNLQLS